MNSRAATSRFSRPAAAGSAHNALVYQGALAVPDLCSGGKLRFDKGGTFSAFLSIS